VLLEFVLRCCDVAVIVVLQVLVEKVLQCSSCNVAVPVLVSQLTCWCCWSWCYTYSGVL